MEWTNERELMAHAAALRGLPLGDIDPSLNTIVPSASTKGFIGQAIEAYFNIATNSTQEPDFPELGIELKVTPVRRGSSGFRSKERVSITQINYADMLETPYLMSHLRSKTRKILFVFYEYVPFEPIGAFPITRVHLWHPTPFEEDALRSTYGYVKRAVVAGRAHELSGSDTTFIESVTKGAGANIVSQPNSDEVARRRAFAFKVGAMSQIYRDIAAGTRDQPDEGPQAVDAIDSYIAQQVDPWIGKAFAEIQAAVAPETIGADDKSLVARVGRRLLGAPSRRMAVPVLERRGVTVRTTRVDKETLRPFEATSFPAIRFEDVTDMTWEDSPEHDLVSDMVLVVFGGDRGDRADLRLLGTVRWRPESPELVEMGDEWEQLAGFVREGNMEERPTATTTTYLHIRPHGADSDDREVLPNGRMFMRSSFWLNQDLIRDLIDQQLRDGSTDSSVE